MAADYYTLLTTAGLAYETAAKAAGTPIKLTKMSVGDGNGAVYNPDATMAALKREVWRGDINALIQDANNSSWLIAELTIPDDVGGWYVREAGIWTDTGVLYAVVKYPESYKPVQATSGSGKEFYLRAIFQTSNAPSVTLSVDETVVKATRAWVADYVASELAKRDAKQSVRVATTAEITLSGAQTIDSVAVVAGDRVLVKNQSNAALNGIWVVANGAWVRATDADASAEVTPGMLVVIEEGTANATTVWQLVTDAPITLGTTGLVFVADYTAAQLDALLATKAPLESPVLTGKPKAPKAPKFTTGSQVVNVDALKEAGLQFSAIKLLDLSAATVALAAADAGSLVVFSGTGGGTLTLPKANTVPAGSAIAVRANNTLTTLNTLKAAAGDILNGYLNSLTGTVDAGIMRAGDSVIVVSDGVSNWFISEDSSYNTVFTNILRYFASEQSLSVGAGTQKFPGGLIIQTGSVSDTSTATSRVVTYPRAFPTACIGFLITSWNANNSNYSHSGRAAGSVSVFRGSNAAYTFDWVAVGF